LVGMRHPDEQRRHTAPPDRQELDRAALRGPSYLLEPYERRKLRREPSRAVPQLRERMELAEVRNAIQQPIDIHALPVPPPTRLSRRLRRPRHGSRLLYLRSTLASDPKRSLGLDQDSSLDE